jgi:hypothetical protein
MMKENLDNQPVHVSDDICYDLLFGLRISERFVAFSLLWLA